MARYSFEVISMFANPHKRSAFSASSYPAKRTRRKTRPRVLLLEQLEDLIVPADVSWAVDVDGCWGVRSNWGTGVVPGPDDDGCVDRPAGSFTITHRTGGTAIKSLATTEQVVLSGGSLSATDSIQFANSFRLQGGTLLNT